MRLPPHPPRPPRPPRAPRPPQGGPGNPVDAFKGTYNAMMKGPSAGTIDDTEKAKLKGMCAKGNMDPGSARAIGAWLNQIGRSDLSQYIFGG